MRSNGTLPMRSTMSASCCCRSLSVPGTVGMVGTAVSMSMVAEEALGTKSSAT